MKYAAAATTTIMTIAATGPTTVTLHPLKNTHCNINKHFQDPINKHSAARDARKRHATMTHGVNYLDLCLVNETPIQE